eukprot:PITA_26003
MTKWVEAKALIRANQGSSLNFLFEEIFVRFGVPRELVTEGGPPFNSHGFKAMLQTYDMHHKMTTPYHPQANGQVESTNKVIEAILTKIVKENRKDWSQRLPEALWAYRTTWRNTTGFCPYELIHGKSVVFPVEFKIKTLIITLTVNLDLTVVQRVRLQQLQELDEKRLDSIHQTNMIQQQRTRWRDKTIKHKQFQKGNWAPLYNSRFENFQGKLRTRWLGPYEIDNIFPNGTNPPPLNNPPVEPQEVAEISQPAVKIPKEAAKIPQEVAKIPQEAVEIPQTAAKIPQVDAETPEVPLEIPQQTPRIPQQSENPSAQ